MLVRGLWVIAKKRLREFWEKHPDTEQPLKAWHQEAERASWSSPDDIKRQYASASILANDRVVFNIKGNSYRLVVHVKYGHMVFIRFIGTHAEYDKINAAEV